MSASDLVAVITGGAQGIGASAGRHLAARGYRIHAIDRRPSSDPGVTSHICDVTDDVALADLASRIGPIDVLVPAAGINLRPNDNAAEKLTLEAWNRTLAVNLSGVMLAVRHFRPHMRADGAIVTVSSIAALRAMPLSDAYTASKGAIVALTRSWAVDYSRYGIRVNCVCPGAARWRSPRVAARTRRRGRNAVKSMSALASASYDHWSPPVDPASSPGATDKDARPDPTRTAFGAP